MQVNTMNESQMMILESFAGAADVNGDSKITISDAVGIVNIILNGSEATVAPALSKPE